MREIHEKEETHLEREGRLEAKIREMKTGVETAI